MKENWLHLPVSNSWHDKDSSPFHEADSIRARHIYLMYRIMYFIKIRLQFEPKQAEKEERGS